MSTRTRIGKALSITAIVAFAVPSLGFPRVAAEVAPAPTPTVSRDRDERTAQAPATAAVARASFEGRLHVFRRRAAGQLGAGR